MKKIDPDDFRVRPGKKVDLDKWPTQMKARISLAGRVSNASRGPHPTN